MGTNGKSIEDAYHYRDGICCATCPAYEAKPYRKESVLSLLCLNGTCKRHKTLVEMTKVCDKHPAWKIRTQGGIIR
jgi:hypothetical protein